MFLTEHFDESINIDAAHVAPHQKTWLTIQLAALCASAPSAREQRRALMLLERSEQTENELQLQYPHIKRFSLQGLDTYLVVLWTLIDQCTRNDIKWLMAAMPHRGRINTLINVLGVNPAAIYAAFERQPTQSFHDFDLPYHFGASASFGELNVSLLYNPSHLELIDPVLVGAARALQDKIGRAHVLPVLAHGDAGFIGQGIVAETLNLSALPGYSVHGTIHIVLNNAVGFTAEPEEYQSTEECTDIATAFGVPVLHIDARDVDAVMVATRLAFMYRLKFARDIVLDLQGIRRLGHNEQDDPAITQPCLYRSFAEIPAIAETYRRRIGDAAKLPVELSVAPLSAATPASQMPTASALDAVIELNRLIALAEPFIRVPDDFHAHEAIEAMTETWRRQMAGAIPVDWTLAENLAIASLLADGVPVRLTGMDSIRGTFHHRYASWYDQRTGEEYRPMDRVPGLKVHFDIHNSPLSEVACLGFEYGYSLHFEGLTIWEAQFGDFVNNAQALIDQIIVSAEAKWNYKSRLCIALPHGYEGYGPEHSSGFMGRFLALAADRNLRIEVPATAAQWFHMLRRQALTPTRKPLIAFVPKDMLRANIASHSRLRDFTTASAQDAVYYPSAQPPRRLVACCGKVFFDLVSEMISSGIDDVALLRLERLYPFPLETLRSLAIPESVVDFCWLQEEAKNHGAWYVLRDDLEAWTGRHWRYAGREPMAAAADCDYIRFDERQRAIVRTALQLR